MLHERANLCFSRTLPFLQMIFEQHDIVILLTGWFYSHVNRKKKKQSHVQPLTATSLSVSEWGENTCSGLVLIAVFWLPLLYCVVESMASHTSFSMTVKTLINQLIGQHAWKGQLSVTVSGSHEALWQMSCLRGLGDWSPASGSPLISRTRPYHLFQHIFSLSHFPLPVH